MCTTAQSADRQAAAQSLSVRDHVRANAEVFLGASACEPEPDEHFIEDEHDASPSAHPTQLLEPNGVRDPIEVRLARTVDERGIAWRGSIRVQRLKRVDENARDVFASTQDPQRGLAHLCERVGLPRSDRVADARLHIAPPTVIRAAERHDMRTPCVIASEAHCLHHCLGAGHVERDFVKLRDLAQPLRVERDERVVGAKNGPEVPGVLHGSFDALPVEVVAEEIHAVGTGQIEELIAVEVGDRDAARGLKERPGGQSAQKAAELKRHAVLAGEAKVGNAVLRLPSQRARTIEAFREQGLQFSQPQPAALTHLGRRAVDRQHLLLGIFVERDEP